MLSRLQWWEWALYKFIWAHLTRVLCTTSMRVLYISTVYGLFCRALTVLILSKYLSSASIGLHHFYMSSAYEYFIWVFSLALRWLQTRYRKESIFTAPRCLCPSGLRQMASVCWPGDQLHLISRRVTVLLSRAVWMSAGFWACFENQHSGFIGEDLASLCLCVGVICRSIVGSQFLCIDRQRIKLIMFFQACLIIVPLNHAED